MPPTRFWLKSGFSPVAKKFFSFSALSRPKYDTVPLRLLPPDLVTTDTTAASADPYSAPNWLRNTLNSCTASCGMLIVGLPHTASSMSPPSMIVV